MILVVLPAHLRALAGVKGDLELEIDGPVTRQSILDAVEARYPMLRGTIRDHVGGARRPLLRFFACGEDVTHEPADAPLPQAIASGREPFYIIGAIAGGNHKGEIMTTDNTSTIRLHRVLTAPPERVYKAFLDPGAMCKWLPPNGFTGTVHHLEPTVGGTYRMSFTNFSTGSSHAFGGEYLELVPNERIRNTDRFEDPNMPGEMITTVTLKKVSVGTELNIVQEGVPAAIPAEACYLGWQESLTLLKQLVEAEIPDGGAPQ